MTEYERGYRDALEAAAGATAIYYDYWSGTGECEKDIGLVKIIAAVIRALPVPASEAESAPDGWVMVPREPTSEMNRSGIATGLIAQAIKEGPAHWQIHYPAAIYRAMLAAAPQPPEKEGEG